MALTCGSFTFSGTYNLYGRPRFGGFVSGVQRTAFPGSLGMAELRDPIKGREIVIPYRVGATSEANLFSAIDTLSKAAGQVNGTLTADSVSFANTTFIEFSPQEQMQPVQGTGSLAWIQRGFLRFLQLSTYEPAEPAEE